MMHLLDLMPAKRLHIDLLAPPFSGHLHPVLALGRELSTRHDVRIISTQGALKRIEVAGLNGVALMGEYEQQLLAIANPQHAVGSNPLKLYRQFKAAMLLLSQFRDELQTLYQQSGKPDLMIADFTLPVAGIVAQKLDIPWWTSLPSPCVLETPDGPPSYCGGLFPPKTSWQRLSQAIARKKVRLFKQSIFRLFRQPIREVGMWDLYRDDGTEAAYSPECILALGNETIEFPRTWPASVRFIGPALYTPPNDLPAPVFQSGKRHILITLGTHLAWHKNEVVAAITELARSRPEWVFHFSDGDTSATSDQLCKNFIRLAYVDYDKHLQNYDVVIHHGGAGIMYYCLKYHKPALIYPVDYDQFDHAARLEASGNGIWLKGGLSELQNAGMLIEKLLRH